MQVKIVDNNLIVGKHSYPIPIRIPSLFSTDKEGYIVEEVYEELPPIRWAEFPDDIKTIYNYGLPKNKQKWETLLPLIGRQKYEKLGGDLLYEFIRTVKEGNTKTESLKQKEMFLKEKGFLTNENLREFQQFISRSLHIRKHGLWFFNNGFPTYITGNHAFELLWWITTTYEGMSLKKYRDKDRRIYLTWEFCDNDLNCFGLNYLKCRRDGSTGKAMVITYNKATMNLGVMTGLQSQNDMQSSIIFKTFLVDPWRKLPLFLKPKDDGQKNPKTQMNFTPPSVKNTKSQLDILFQEEMMKTKSDHDDVIGVNYLDSFITYMATKENAYDGQRLAFYLLDEAAKLGKISVSKMWSIVKKCLQIGSRVIGKAYVTTTVEEVEKGGGAFLDLWDLSSYQDLNRNNQTASGLYRLFLPAQDGYAGFLDEYGYSVIRTETPFINEFGEEKTMGSYDYLKNTRADLEERGEQEALTNEVRMNPMSLEEAILSINNISLFDTKKIQLQLNSLSNGQLRRGNFEFNEDKTLVKFVDAENGRFLLSKVFDDSLMNKVLIQKDKHIVTLASGGKILVDKKKPLNAHQFVIGCDPVDNKIYDNDTSGLSRAAAYVFLKTQLHDPENTGFPVVEYLNHAQKNPSQFYDDMMALCHYFGCEILVEHQKMQGLQKHFEDAGYFDFLMKRPKSGFNVIENVSKLGIAAGDATNQLLAAEVSSFVAHSIHKILFPQLLKQMIPFNLERTKKFDAVMGFGWALVASKIITFNTQKSYYNGNGNNKLKLFNKKKRTYGN
jgi:hypothetical protein